VLGWALGGWARVRDGIGEIGLAAFEQFQPDLAGPTGSGGYGSGHAVRLVLRDAGPVTVTPGG
jgi:hypothetical protein